MNFIRIIFLLILSYLVSYLYRKLWKDKNKVFSGTKTNNNIIPEEMMQDPICKTYVPKSQAITYSEKKEMIYFCSEECKGKYKEEKK